MHNEAEKQRVQHIPVNSAETSEVGETSKFKEAGIGQRLRANSQIAEDR